MREDQMLLFVMTAFLGSGFAGLWARKSLSQTAIVLGVTFLNVAGWMTYGFVQNWEPTWGLKNVIGGILYAAPGMLIFSIFPALIGCALSIFLKSLLWKKTSPDIEP